MTMTRTAIQMAEVTMCPCPAQASERDYRDDR